MKDNVLKVLAIALVVFSIPFLQLGSELTINKMFSSPMIERIDNMPVFKIKSQKIQPDEIYMPMIRLEDKQNGFFCSATVISDKFAITAAHCLIGNNLSKKMRKDKFFGVAANKNKLRVNVLAAAVNKRADYALVTGDFTKFKKIDIALTPIEAVQYSQFLSSCGFPWGASPICYPVNPNLKIYFEFWAAPGGVMYPGCSGGPVIDQLNGKIIAINSVVGNGYTVFAGVTGLFETLGVQVIK